MGDIVNLDDVIRKEMERNNVTKPGEMVLNPVNREEPSNSLMTVATAMRTAADDIESCIELADDILGFICEKLVLIMVHLRLKMNMLNFYGKFAG